MTDSVVRDPHWRSIAFYGLAKIGPGLLMFAAVPVWTRAFGVEQYGIYTICWAAALFSSSFFTGWIRQAVLRNSGMSAHALEALPRWVVPWCVALSVVPVALIVAAQSSASDDALPVIASSVVFGIANSYYVVAQVRAQRNDQSGRYTTAEFVRIGSALGGSLLLARVTATSGAVSILIAFAIGTLLAIGILRTTPAAHVPARSREVLVSYWTFGWPMAIWLTLSSLLVYVDRLIIGAALGDEAAGTYAAYADVMVRGFAMIAFPLTMASHPIMMRRWNAGDQAGAVQILAKYTKLLVLLSCLVFALILAVGTPALEVILGIPVTNPFLVPALALGAAAWQIALISHKPLEMMDRSRTMVVVMAGVAVMSFVLNSLFIPVFGMAVAAFVFCFGAVLYVAVTTILGRHALRSLKES